MAKAGRDETKRLATLLVVLVTLWGISASVSPVQQALEAATGVAGAAILHPSRVAEVVARAALAAFSQVASMLKTGSRRG